MRDVLSLQLLGRWERLERGLRSAPRPSAGRHCPTLSTFCSRAPGLSKKEPHLSAIAEMASLAEVPVESKRLKDLAQAGRRRRGALKTIGISFPRRPRRLRGSCLDT